MRKQASRSVTPTRSPWTTVERADIDEADAGNRIGKRASLGRRDELFVVVQSRRLADTSGQRALVRLSLTSPVG
jgi:hypothetical protein